MELMIQVKVFWVMMLCSIVVGYQCFRGPCYSIIKVKMEAAWICETLVSYSILANLNLIIRI